ncbi:DUF6710 family protein [Levilactobacillus parabrevis]|uniref:Uncharacterized protein n=1 Tax=Levilactobacillus parabrevis ATCC 53295 TaxID=1267003 RepID=A0A0R1H6H7_9LACO|nr:DUF6710 family protein [Levilactobacillus parabrevis]KRK39425.1 hypothetical protein FD07_GL001224 [Levilactobacillus parabrevis ATCC 53295]KRO07326.1 hypothetical protein IV61_GL000138 [Levilactobacillus parabrevis]
MNVITNLFHHQKIISSQKKITSSQDQSEISKTLKYLNNPGYLQVTEDKKAMALMYIQKSICNAILYDSCVYKTLNRPNSADDFRTWYLPLRRNETDRYIYRRLKNRLYLDAVKTPFVVYPWNNERIVSNLLTIGDDVENRLNEKDSNIENSYIYPLGVAVCLNGNHSQFAALLKNEMTTIKIDSVYDISLAMEDMKVLENGVIKSTEYFDFEKESHEKIKDLFRVGLSLREYPDMFPEAIRKFIAEMGTDIK